MFKRFTKTENALQRTRESWFEKIAGLFERNVIDESLWDELEELLISADVGIDTTGILVDRVKKRSKDDKLTGSEQVRQALKQEMILMLTGNNNGFASIEQRFVAMVVGVNGSGKTTSIAKLAHYLKKEGRSVVIAAADTFRAAAIDQLQLWGQRISVDVVAHKPGGDPGAVVFDAIKSSISRGIDVVIVDTAGRLHTKFNLMEELKKIKRIAVGDGDKKTETLLVLDATTGQNGLSQAKYFSEAVDITGVFLSKLDGTAKGGIVLAICNQLGLPIYFVGTGEALDDIAPFEAKAFVDALMK